MGTAGQPFVEREGPGFGSAADAPQRRAETPLRPPAAAGAARLPAAAAAPERGGSAIRCSSRVCRS